MVGVLGCFLASTSSISLGRPSVTSLSFTPAKWNVRKVIWVPGSPMDCAPTTPMASPGSTRAALYSSAAFSTTALAAFLLRGVLSESLAGRRMYLSSSIILGLSLDENSWRRDSTSFLLLLQPSGHP